MSGSGGGSGSGSGGGSGSASGDGSGTSGSGVATAGGIGTAGVTGGSGTAGAVVDTMVVGNPLGMNVFTSDSAYVGTVTEVKSRTDAGIAALVQIDNRLGLTPGLTEFRFARDAIRGDTVVLNITLAQLQDQLQ